MPFHFERANTSIHRLWSPFPIPVLHAIGDTKGKGEAGRGTSCVDIFPPPSSFYFPLGWIPRLLAFPWLSFPSPCTHLSFQWGLQHYHEMRECFAGLGTYCQVNQGALQLKYYLRQRESKKARIGERRILQHSRNVGNMTQDSVCCQSFTHCRCFSHAFYHIPPLYYAFNIFQIYLFFLN